MYIRQEGEEDGQREELRGGCTVVLPETGESSGAQRRRWRRAVSCPLPLFSSSCFWEEACLCQAARASYNAEPSSCQRGPGDLDCSPGGGGAVRVPHFT